MSRLFLSPLIGLFGAVCLLASATLALAHEGDHPQRTGSGPVLFAIPDVWPWAYTDENGAPAGSLVELVQRLSELSGVDVHANLRPLRRALREVDSGEVNFGLFFQSPEMDERAINVGQVLRVNLVLAAPANTSHPLSLDALARKRIGYIRGTYLGEAFAADTDVEKVPVAVIEQAIEMLPMGRLSAILASDHAILRTLDTMDMDRSELRYTIHVADQSGALYMSRKAQRPEVAARFRDAIGQMEAAGEFDRIFFGEAGRPEYEGGGPQAPAQ